MLEKMYDVKMGIRNHNSTDWELKTFTVIDKSSEGARVKALIRAAQCYPISERWEYDHTNATVEELSQDQVKEGLENHRLEIAKESKEKIKEALAELAKIGVYLPGVDPESE